MGIRALLRRRTEPRPGLGLAHALERCDRDGLPAYLEATSARSKALYQRHGFQEVGAIQEGNSPELYPMLRPAR